MVLNSAVIVSLVSLFSPFFLPSPVNDDGVSFSFAWDQYQRRLFQLSLSIPSLEGRGGKRDVWEQWWSLERCYVASCAHAVCVSACVQCVCSATVQPGVFVIPCGFSYASQAGRKHINLSNTNSEKRSGRRCVCQEAAED